MTAALIKGAEVAAQICEELKKEIADLKAKHNIVPGLVMILVGADPASQVYVGQKAITPFPGGVGPMTIIMLMMNTVRAAKVAAALK